MSEPVDRVLATLQGVKRAGGQYQARCPAHEDRVASLTVKAGEDGRALIHCHAGCQPAEILRAIGLEEADLFPPRPGPAREVAAVYDYQDEAGDLLFQSVRLEPKDFRQRKPNGAGGWIWSLNGTRRVPYRLPELLASGACHVFVVEGEKDADALAALGFVATTNPAGAGKWRPEYNAHFKGRPVVILPDNDDPGRQHAVQVAAQLHGIAADLRIVDLPDLPAKGDVSDWIAAGGTAAQLKAVVTKTASWVAKPPPTAGEVRFKSARQRATEKPPQIDWIIGGLAAAGAVTELDGPQKQGKTTFLAHAVRAKLDGKPFLGLPTRPGPAVWLSEESWNVLQEPLGEAGLLDRDDLYLVCREDAFGLPWTDLAAEARRFAVEVGANLLIGDTLSSLAGLKGDEENSSGSAMEAVRPVQEIAANGTAVIVSRHDRRAGGEVGESGRGSTAFAGAVDLIFRFKRLGGDGRATMRRLEYVGRIRGVPAERIIELTDSGYRFVGTDADVKLQEAKDLLLDHLPDSEEEAVSLPSLWARAREATDKKPAVEAGPLAGSEIGKTTFRDAAEALLGAGRLAKKEITARNHVWWCVSGAPVPTGHVGNESVGERESGYVSGGPSPIRTDTPDTRTPDAGAPDVLGDPVVVAAIERLGGRVLAVNPTKEAQP